MKKVRAYHWLQVRSVSICSDESAVRISLIVAPFCICNLFTIADLLMRTAWPQNDKVIDVWHDANMLTVHCKTWLAKNRSVDDKPMESVYIRLPTVLHFTTQWWSSTGRFEKKENWCGVFRSKMLSCHILELDIVLLFLKWRPSYENSIFQNSYMILFLASFAQKNTYAMI